MWELKRFKGPPGRTAKELGWTIHFGVFAFMLAVTAPRLLRPLCPTADALDTSWAWMLAHALQHHMQWGTTILFTYGPLGFLARSYFYPDHTLWALTATIRLASWFVFGLGFAALLRRLAPDNRPFSRTTLPVAIGWIVGTSFVHLPVECALLALLLLALAMAEENPTVAIAALILSGSLLALGSMIKSTALIVSLFALLIYPALWWYAGHRRSRPYLPLVPLLSFWVSFCALWVIASQSLAHLPAYFRGTWAIASGYTPAMSIPGMRLQMASALAILALFVAVLTGLLISGKKVRVAQCLLLGGLAFWAWKEGFTRQDWGYFRHPMIFYGTALLIATVGATLVSKQNTRHLSIFAYCAYGIALWFSMQGYPTLSLSYKSALHNYEDFVTLISSEPHRVAEQRSQTAAIKRQLELPDGALNAVGHASVNVIPWSLMMTQGYHMRLVASPIIQSYSVYTPYLDRMNAHQIWSGKSAEKIIYSYLTLDQRYPAFDEPATFRAILACYRTQYPGIPYAVLRHAPCTPPELTAADNPRTGSFGKWIPIPPRASYVDIGVRVTAIGHVMDVLFKPRQVWIYFRLQDGAMKGPYRFIYPVGNDGLFIRYFIGSQSDADLLFSGNTSGLQRIVAMRIAATDTPRKPRASIPRSWNRTDSPDYANQVDIQFLREKRRHRYLWGSAGQPPFAGESRH